MVLDAMMILGNAAVLCGSLLPVTLVPNYVVNVCSFMILWEKNNNKKNETRWLSSFMIILEEW